MSYEMPQHKRDQVQAGIRETTTREVVAVVACLRGMAASFDDLDATFTFTAADVATLLRSTAREFEVARPEIKEYLP